MSVPSPFETRRYSRQETVFTLVGVLLAMFLGALDQTIVSTALPRIVEDLHGLDRYAWVATSYLLASTVLVPIYGRLADIFEKRTIELVAVSLFLAGSFLCGLAGEFGDLPLLGDGMTQLVVFRGLQGVGGAGLFSMAFIVIADLFPPAERAKYQGFVGAVFGLSSVLGPWLGGLLTDYGGGIIEGVEGWRWVFYVNVPFGALALGFIATRMPPLPPAEKGRLDVVAALLLIAGLVPLVLALQLDKQQWPWLSPTVIGLLAGAVVCLALFTWRSLKAEQPILDFSLFKERVFSTANLTLFLLGATFLGVLIFLPLFMVNVVGVSATKAGTSLIPLSLGLVFGAIASGQIVARIGHYKLLMLGGNGLLLLGVFLLSGMTVNTSYLDATLIMVVVGLGLGPGFPLYTLAIQNAVPVTRVGQATSASQFFRQIGGTVGAALLGTILASGLAAAFADGSGPRDPGASGEEGRTPRGLDEVRKEIAAGFDAQFQRIEAAFAGDEAAIAALREDPRVPPDLKARLGQPVPPEQRVGALAGVRAQLDAQAEEVASVVVEKIRLAFATAITDIYKVSVVIALLALLSTLLVPSVPLRKTFDRPPPVEG